MKKKASKITLISGLPGSGKTTLASTIERDFISLDNVDIEKSFTVYSSVNHNHIVVEGLISGRNFFRILDWTKTGLGESWADIKEINIVCFKEDRGACLLNDRARGREQDAGITIKYMTIDLPRREEFLDRYPDIEFVFEKRDVIMIDSEIVRKWAIEKLEIDEHILHKSPYYYYNRANNHDGVYLFGEQWSLGGTYGNCWDNKLRSISPSKPVEGFPELEDILLKVCPQLSFLQYRAVERFCVSTETESRSDYYGGSEELCYKVCDLKKLYMWLKNNNLL